MIREVSNGHSQEWMQLYVLLEQNLEQVSKSLIIFQFNIKILLLILRKKHQEEEINYICKTYSC